jgi:hypothetical protein
MELTNKSINLPFIIKTVVIITALLFLYSTMTPPNQITLPTLYQTTAAEDSACLDINGWHIPCP